MPWIWNITHGGSTMSLNPCWLLWFNINQFILNLGFFSLSWFGKGIRVAHWRGRTCLHGCAVLSIHQKPKTGPFITYTIHPVHHEVRPGEKPKKLGEEVFPQFYRTPVINRSPGQTETVYAQTFHNSLQ